MRTYAPEVGSKVPPTVPRLPSGAAVLVAQGRPAELEAGGVTAESHPRHGAIFTYVTPGI